MRSFGWAQPHVASDMASVCVCVCRLRRCFIHVLMSLIVSYSGVFGLVAASGTLNRLVTLSVKSSLPHKSMKLIYRYTYKLKVLKLKITKEDGYW